MKTITISALLACGLLASCEKTSQAFQPDTIVALERQALDRWGKGDPAGYLELYAPEITYFDPARAKRADGLEAMKEYYATIAGKVHVDSYEMLEPKVQRHGDVAVLSFQLLSHGKSPKGVPFTLRWNSTEVYGLIAGKWKIIHNHWSFIQPELKQQSPE